MPHTFPPPARAASPAPFGLPVLLLRCFPARALCPAIPGSSPQLFSSSVPIWPGSNPPGPPRPPRPPHLKICFHQRRAAGRQCAAGNRQGACVQPNLGNICPKSGSPASARFGASNRALGRSDIRRRRLPCGWVRLHVHILHWTTGNAAQNVPRVASIRRLSVVQQLPMCVLQAP